MIGVRILGGALLAVMTASCGTAPATNASQPAPASAPARVAPSGLNLASLSIRSGGRTHVFTVEVARSSEEQAQGLMFRQSLGADEGMIFPFTPPRPASFWMRNTLIPLDMIFIRPDGTIARIAANTVPLSEALVGVGEPVAAVLELRGGRAAELGITARDRVTWRE